MEGQLFNLFTLGVAREEEMKQFKSIKSQARIRGR